VVWPLGLSKGSEEDGQHLLTVGSGGDWCGPQSRGLRGLARRQKALLTPDVTIDGEDPGLVGGCGTDR